MNGPVIDPWTAVHGATGAIAALAGVPWPIALGGAVAYELLEQVAERTELGRRLFGTSGPESIANAVTDVVVYMGSYFATKAAMRTFR